MMEIETLIEAMGYFSAVSLHSHLVLQVDNRLSPDGLVSKNIAI